MGQTRLWAAPLSSAEWSGREGSWTEEAKGRSVGSVVLGEAGHVAMRLSGQDVTLAAPECSLWPGFLLTPHAPPSTSLLRLIATVQVTNPQIFTSARVILSLLDVPTLCKPYGQIELSFRLTLAPSAPLSGVAVRSHSPVFSLVASSTSTFGRCSTAAHLAPTRSEPASSSLGQCRSLSGFLPPPPNRPSAFLLGGRGEGWF